MNDSYEVLTGGNMNAPLKKNNRVYKEATAASQTIHALLLHVKSRGVDWVPESYGIDENGKHVLSYIDGLVPDDMPEWIWDESLLAVTARKLREWHDATVDFAYEQAKWLFKNDEPHEVICHNDFAPYNCVYKNNTFHGLIDFDVCSPGSRLWDIAYAMYRFVPLMPDDRTKNYYEYSPFSRNVMLTRLTLFLKAYAGTNHALLYDKNQVITCVSKRLNALATWTRSFAHESNNEELIEHAKMYSLHAQWVEHLR